MNVLNVDVSTAGGGPERRAGRAATTLEGAVKWFEPDKGYGFIAPDGGGKDIFIHVTALRRSGVTALAQGQRVRVDVVDGKKGLEADRIILI
jgi:cold shock protein